MVEIPEHLLERSRAARARLTGQAAPAPAAAAEGEAPAAEAPAAEAPAPAAAAPEPVAPEPIAPEPVPAAEAPPSQLPAIPETVGVSSGIALPPAAAPLRGAPLEIGIRGLAGRTGEAVTPLRARSLAVPVTDGDEVVESAGISQYTRTSSPRWLVGFSGILAVLALVYIVQFQAGPKCGQAGAVRVSDKDGSLVNCEGEPIGPQPGPNERKGLLIYQTNCATCHGAQGQGGVGRKLNTDPESTLTADFPTLAAQVEFVKGGSAKFPVYGAAGRQAVGNMPAWSPQLSDEEIVSAVMYERHVLHGLDGTDPRKRCRRHLAPPPRVASRQPPRRPPSPAPLPRR